MKNKKFSKYKSRRDENFEEEEESYNDEDLSQKEEESEIEDESVSSENSENMNYEEVNNIQTIEESDHEEVNYDDKQTFNNYLFSVRSNIEEVNKKLSFLDSNLDKADMKYGISYLDSKNSMMLIYLSNLVMFSILKTSGRDIKNSEVIKRLIYVKTVLEKSKVIDLKLKNQIEKLIKLSNSNEDNKIENDENYRPRIMDMEDDDQEEIEEEKLQEEKKKIKYKVQKNFQEFFETKNDNKKRQRKIEKTKEKIRNSEFFNELKEEFNDNPMEVKMFDTEMDKLQKQVEDYETEHMVRVKIPKRELQKIRKKDREVSDFSNIERDFKNFDRILRQDNDDELLEEMKFNSSKKLIGSKTTKRGNERGNYKKKKFK